MDAIVYFDQRHPMSVMLCRSDAPPRLVILVVVMRRHPDDECSEEE